MNFVKKYWFPMLLAVGGGYFVVKNLIDKRNKKGKIKLGEPEKINDEFPLKKGSTGTKVKELQDAILLYNPNFLPKYGADSDYGTETELAVKSILGKVTIDSQEDIATIISKSVLTKKAREDADKIVKSRIEAANKLIEVAKTFNLAFENWFLVTSNKVDIILQDYNPITKTVKNKKTITYEINKKIISNKEISSMYADINGFLKIVVSNAKLYTISPFAVKWEK